MKEYSLILERIREEFPHLCESQSRIGQPQEDHDFERSTASSEIEDLEESIQKVLDFEITPLDFEL